MQAYGGISRYVVELARHLALIDSLSVRVLAPLHKNQYLRNASDVPKRSVYLRRMPNKIRTGLDQLACDGMISMFRPDITHATYYLRNCRPTKTRRLVVTVHDMIHEKFPESFPLEDDTLAFKRAAVAAADHIICISENTRKDAIELLGVPAGRTTVIHHGVPEPLPGELPPSLCGKPFFLFVGQRSGYKNFDRVLRAYAASASLRRDFQLVAFGGNCFTEAEHCLIQQLAIDRSRLVQLSGDDTVLSALYRHAAAFIYPSLYEGFGMPLLEAMVHGCPVLSSNTSCLPEIAASAAVYFDPLSTDDTQHALESIAYDHELQLRFRKAGLERSSEFSWQKAAQETHAVYTKLLN